MMEAVSRRLRIAATTFHTTSTRPIPWYSPPPLEIRTTTCHVNFSAILPSPKYTLAGATTFYQLISTLSVPASISASVPSSSGTHVASTVFTSVASAFCASSSHPFRCSACIPEGPLERLFRSLRTTHSISSSVGTESSTWNVSMNRGLFSPGGCPFQYRSTCSVVIRLGVTQAGSVDRLTTALYHPFIW